MKFEPKKALIGIGAAFVLLTVWNDPQKAGDNTGNFLSDATQWVGDAFDKANDFSQSVTD
ncbi:MAG TPA: hypothetical protein VGJ86_06820 [Acidimicrobiales bacterium]